LKKLFGSSSPDNGACADRGKPVEHRGFRIQPAPEPEGGQWRLAGYILSGSGDNPMEQKFVRADLFDSRDEAIEFAVRKGKQIIDEQSYRQLADGEKPGST
ncbi:MAG: HlyU family transcriptional regulator, partial [Hyphomicrobiaceae bacterium]